MIATAASHKCMTLTDFGVCHFFIAKLLVLMDTFEAGEFTLGQIAFKCSSCNASMQPLASLIFIHGPVILPYISNTV